MDGVHLEGGCHRKTTGFYIGAILERNGLSIVRVSSSEEELKVN